MKKIVLSIVFSLVLFNSVFADVYVNPYVRSDGTYVEGHYRSSPDSTVTNNWSYSGNTNPYTGEVGSNSYGTTGTTGTLGTTSNSLGGNCPALSLSC
jgi:hypothetical protein